MFKRLPGKDGSGDLYATVRIVLPDGNDADLEALIREGVSGAGMPAFPDLSKAEAELTKALATRGNANDPFMHFLLATTYERQGKASEANAMYDRALQLAGRGHNPPAAFVHW